MALNSARWAGNIRQLEHEIERAVILTDDGELIDVSALSVHDGTSPQSLKPSGVTSDMSGPLKMVRQRLGCKYDVPVHLSSYMDNLST